MKEYKTLLFDLDDTLIDNLASIKYVLNSITNELNIEYSNDLLRAWKKADDLYWYKWSIGKIKYPNYIKNNEEKVNYARAYRFIEFFKNITFDEAVYLNELYCNMLGINIIEIEGAKKLLESLKTKYEIVIATNGPKKAAFEKLQKSKLDSYISTLVASEEVGVGKPHHKYFEYLYTKCQNQDKNKMLLIGDSLKTDIKGGINNGIDTCWFNPNNKVTENLKPKIEINKLLQLKKKLSK